MYRSFRWPMIKLCLSQSTLFTVCVRVLVYPVDQFPPHKGKQPQLLPCVSSDLPPASTAAPSCHYLVHLPLLLLMPACGKKHKPNK